MCLGLDKMYTEPIDGLDESIRKKVYALFMSRWNTFHAPVHSACFLIKKDTKNNSSRVNLNQCIGTIVKSVNGSGVAPRGLVSCVFGLESVGI